jgi:hypothetical protein
MEVGLCDFGATPWYRIAWLLIQKYGENNLDRFYGLANIAANIMPCPRRDAVVKEFGGWHTIIDSKTGVPMINFVACSNCVRSVEVLLPAIRGVFVQVPKFCALRFDSNRFIQYFDAIETMADRAEATNEVPDTTVLQNLVRRLALIPECQRDTELFDSKWYIITQLPEFTVCEDCFDDFVRPLMEEEKKFLAIPSLFEKELRRIPRATCQLYPGSNMREIFKLAADTNDYKLLAQKARERKAAEANYRKTLLDIEMRPKDSGGLPNLMKGVTGLEWMMKWSS